MVYICMYLHVFMRASVLVRVCVCAYHIGLRVQGLYMYIFACVYVCECV